MLKIRGGYASCLSRHQWSDARTMWSQMRGERSGLVGTGGGEKEDEEQDKLVEV